MIFGAGLIIGAVGGFFGAKLYLKERTEKDAKEMADEKIREMEDYYEQADKYTRKESDNEKKDPSETKRYSEKEETEEITDYRIMYQRKDEDEKEETEEEDVEETPEDRANEEYETNRNRKPKIISEESLGDLPVHVDHQVMYYYTYNDTVTDEDGNVVEDYERLFGDCMDQFGFRDNDEESILIRNFSTEVVYEVIKEQAAFEEY